MINLVYPLWKCQCGAFNRKNTFSCYRCWRTRYPYGAVSADARLLGLTHDPKLCLEGECGCDLCLDYYA